MYTRPYAPTGIGLGLRFEFLQPVAAGAADGRVDFFELTPENFLGRGGALRRGLDAVTSRAPCVSHGLSLSLGGHDPLDLAQLRALRDFLRALELPYHSDHLCFSAAGGSQFHELLPIPFSERSVRQCAERIQRVQDALGLPMVIENISYYGLPEVPAMSELEFISRVLSLADCGLLLDLNNLHVNALNHGGDPFAALTALPLERVVQVHVAGPEHWEEDDLWVDSHAAPVPTRVKEMLSALIARTGPLPVLLERDGNQPGLAGLLAEVDELRGIYQAGLDAHARATLPAQARRAS